jgi:hypothetical protein
VGRGLDAGLGRFGARGLLPLFSVSFFFEKKKLQMTSNQLPNFLKFKEIYLNSKKQVFKIKQDF